MDLFCEAISELNYKGIVVGDGSEREKLEKKYSNIEFTGWKCQKEVKEYMKRAKALIFPSRWYETAGLTVIESECLGIDCIVSENCAATEFINSNNSRTFNIYKNNDLKNQILNFEKNNRTEKCITKYIFSYKNYFIELMKVYEG